MATAISETTVKGGAWLIDETDPATVMTPEKLNDEHKLIRQTAAEFIKGEVLPLVERLEKKEWALNLDPDKVNVNGGAIALGHPLGCTGAKLTATIINEMHRRKARYGMVTMCVGGGMGAAGIFERM